ncbi:MAG: hypothetical protein ACTSVI_00925 [Promethearchaeota archaeon]
MTKIILQKETMPHYQQLKDACGLSAVLMMIQPNIDKASRELLEKIGDKIKQAFPGLSSLMEDANTKHQVAAAFTILKAAKSDEIGDYLKRFDKDNYEFIQEVILHELQKRMTGQPGRIGRSLEKKLENYIKKGTFDKTFLQEYTTKIKTDVELKLLLACFGYRFVQFPYSPDGTGSINLETIDSIVKNNLIRDEESNNYDEVLEFMLTFLKVNFDKCMILINIGFHWVPAAKIIIEDKRFPELYYLDSSRTRGELVKLTHWKSSKYFYFFRQDPILKIDMQRFLKRILELK